MTVGHSSICWGCHQRSNSRWCIREHHLERTVVEIKLVAAAEPLGSGTFKLCSNYRHRPQTSLGYSRTISNWWRSVHGPRTLIPAHSQVSVAAIVNFCAWTTPQHILRPIYRQNSKSEHTVKHEVEYVRDQLQLRHCDLPFLELIQEPVRNGSPLVSWVSNA
jgi:hypothetical protein